MLKSLKNNVLDLDIRLLKRIYFSSERYMVNQSMILFTKSADGIWYLLVGLLLVLFDLKIGLNFAILVIIAFIIEITLQKSIKLFVKRNRPGWVIDGISFLINPPDKFSFPSGHTAGAFIFVFSTYHFYPIWFPIILLWASLVGISRIYNGVHYPSDVIAGAILGSCSWFFATYLFNLFSFSPFI